MKITKIILMLVLSGISLTLTAQIMRKINLEGLGMKYMVPKGWEVDPFGGIDWEQTGSSVCHCAGVINIGDYYGEEELYILFYPAASEDSLNADKRQYAWKMKFYENGVDSISEIRTEKLVFEKRVSEWSVATGSMYYGNEVWQLKTHGEGQYYMIYIWASPEVMGKNEVLIQKILESFEPIKVKKG